jgi:hypothetical protein
MKRKPSLQVSISSLFNCNFIDLQNKFDGEVQTRIEREKDIMQEVDDTKYKLHKKIDEERTDKSLQLGAFKDSVSSQLKRQHKYVEEF